eukprot:Nitzschia sp. Nitz4//scaffold6_size259037//98458//103848//NITZ4_001067-RA/size259037-processed-gene-0.68-mRNA-1//-1//CDS//3329556872//5987//frame0
MNFVAQLEDYLRDLGAEARKKHPGVKEASERAILKLRSLQNSYVTAVRKASGNGDKHPDTTIFRSSDLLHPFLLAANYPNASPKLLDTSFKAMKTLMEANAICPGDGMNLVRVWMIQAQVVVSYSVKEGTTGSSSGNSNTSASVSEMMDAQTAAAIAAQQSSSSSWLGSFLSSSKEGHKTTAAVNVKSAVSSSHGQAGPGHLNAKDLDKLALDILSCLLQLLELRDLPVTPEQWTQSVTLCCLLYLPQRQTVRQAAQSTLPQVLSLLVKDESVEPLAVATWEDLLFCVSGSSQAQPSSKKKHSFHGAFSHCRVGEMDVASPPSASLSLDLMTTLLGVAPSVFSKVGQKALGVVVQALQRRTNNPNTSPVEYLRLLSFVLVVLQTQAQAFPEECRELMGHLLLSITLATESIRKQADFEDGFSYKTPNKNLVASVGTLETLKSLPPTMLWKATITLDTLKAIVHDDNLRSVWMHQDVILHLLEAISDFCTIGASCEAHMHLVVVACRRKQIAVARAAESLQSMEHWKNGMTKDESYVLGEAVWLGLVTTLKMLEDLDDDLVEAAFAPSLAVLQHFLKRFPASGIIVEQVLTGYFALSTSSLDHPLIRRALLTSLCKLSLPQWGTHDASGLLKDHHVATLICLLNIIHRFYDDVESEWSIVLQTFQELSIQPIASPHLCDNAYVGALSISAVYSRLPSFSTCLSDRSLEEFVGGLQFVSTLEHVSNMIVNPVGGMDLLRVPSRSTDTNSKDEKDTFGKTLMNFGVRAIYGGSTADSGGTPPSDDVPLTERSKNSFAHEYLTEFSDRLASSKHPIRAKQVPFVISLLVDIAMANGYRSSACVAALYRRVCSLATDVPSARHFAMDALALLLMSQVSGDEGMPTSFSGPSRVMYKNPRQNQYLAVEAISEGTVATGDVSLADLFAPLSDLIRDAEDAEVVESGLEALHSVIESCGHYLNSDAWTTIIQAVQSVPQSKRSTEEWASPCLVGFKCLKLIVDDFSDQTDTSSKARKSLLECCSSFGSSIHDVNTSLTAIGLLWTIADQDAGPDSIDNALSNLVNLASDSRPEVRNCAVNTLFSCIVGRGSTFSEKQWKACLCDMVLAIFGNVSSSREGGTAAGEPTGSERRKNRYKVSIHHSRDSTGKQWATTQAIVLRGLCRVLRSFFSRLLETTDHDSAQGDSDSPWFEVAWNRILGYAFESSAQEGGRETLDLRNSGVELLVVCAQLACKDGIQAAITPARVGTHMEVVNGALRSVRNPGRNDSNPAPIRTNSANAEMWRENLFLDAFDVLDSFREYLEGASSNQPDEGLHHTLEPTQVQVLSKFVTDMGKLYECCKNEEFKDDPPFSDSKVLDKYFMMPRPSADENDPMVRRFVQIISSVALNTFTSEGARYPSQAQRACLDLLRTMAQDGSAEAFIALAELAGSTFFSRRDEKGKPLPNIDILSHEASTILHEEFSKSVTGMEGKFVTLHRVLLWFRKTVDEDSFEVADLSYDFLVPFIGSSLNQEPPSTDSPESDSMMTILDEVWSMIPLCLSQMFNMKATPAEQDQIVLPDQLSDIVNVVASAASSRRIDTICSVIATGAKQCLLASSSGAAPPEGYLTLFKACFDGVCKMDPRNALLKAMTEEVMNFAVQSVSMQESGEATDSTGNDSKIRACLVVCEVLREESGTGPLVVQVFSQLCRLVGLENQQLRQAAGRALSTVDVTNIIAEADAARLAAEERAVVAEIQVVELRRQVAKLREEKGV